MRVAPAGVRLRSCACALALLGVAPGPTALGAEAASQENSAMPPCYTTGFEAGLDGWETRGQAAFTIDPEQPHGGRASARITVAADARLDYQQIWHRLAEAVTARDGFALRVWVRTAGVATDPGAYAYLEFLDEKGERTGIVHSTTGAANGRSGWQRLEIDRAMAPAGSRAARLGLVLHAAGTAWFDDVEVNRVGSAFPDLGDAVRELRIDPGRVVHPRFGGVGYHAFHHVHDLTPGQLATVVNKRWRELNPSFVRMNDSWDWDRPMLDRVAEYLQFMKSTGTEAYFATWGPKDTPPGPERAAYARRVVDNLEYLVRNKGCTNLTTYCMTNELSLKQWGSLRNDMPTFRDYHRELHRELQARQLPVRLLASDASPIGYWDTIQWAADNMDDITGVYGGHHYLNEFEPDDPTMYPWFLEKMTWGAGLARSKGKDFILGEFGSKQDGRTVDGVKRDCCVYWDTPQESVLGLQLAEAVIAAINGGVYAMGYWTFMDFPDDYRTTYINKWGLFKWSGRDHSTRAVYYAYGLLSKFGRGPATVVGVTSSDPLLRAAALRHHDRGSWTVMVVNRNARPLKLDLALAGDERPDLDLRKYVYDPSAVPQHPFGDLPPPTATVRLAAGRLTDALAANSLTVYTSAFDNDPPGPVRGLTAERTADGHTRLAWTPAAETDLAYYRVYRGTTPDVGRQIGSTLATEFVDETAGAPSAAGYTVVAVDQSGNAGPAR